MDLTTIQNHTFCHHGFPIHAKEYSKGTTDRPLVFIGGAFQNIAQLEKISNELSKETWLIVIDTPGNGDTGVLPHDYRFEFLCEAINSVLTKLDVPEINLIGCSYGSIVALRYAQMYDHVSCLTLASAMDKLPGHLQYEFDHLLFYLKWNRMEQFAAGFTNLLTNPVLREENRICRLTSEKLYHALLKANIGIKEQFKHNTLRIMADGQTDLRKMPDVKTTVFTGEYDHFLPVETNKRIADSFPRGRFVAIPNADHMFHVEQTKLTVRTILESTVQ